MVYRLAALAADSGMPRMRQQMLTERAAGDVGLASLFSQALTLLVGALFIITTANAGSVRRELIAGEEGWVFEEFGKDLAVLRASLMERGGISPGLILFACNKNTWRMRVIVPQDTSQQQQSAPMRGQFMSRTRGFRGSKDTSTNLAEARVLGGGSFELVENSFSYQTVRDITASFRKSARLIELAIRQENDAGSFEKVQTMTIFLDQTAEMVLASSAFLYACSRNS